MKRDRIPHDAELARAVADVVEASRSVVVQIAVIGGMGLRAHNVGRTTLDIDILADGDIDGLVEVLVYNRGWSALEYDLDTDDYVVVNAPPAWHTVEGVLEMLPLHSTDGVVVEFIVADEDNVVALDHALPMTMPGSPVRAPVAPLGAIFAMKMTANRTKDIAAIEQAVEQLPRAAIDRAVSWLQRYNPGAGEEVASIVDEVRMRAPRLQNRGGWRR